VPEADCIVFRELPANILPGCRVCGHWHVDGNGDPNNLKLAWAGGEIARVRCQVRARKCEIRMLPGVPSATAELLLVRIRARSTISAGRAAKQGV
jgi:hypothetical protein